MNLILFGRARIYRLAKAGFIVTWKQFLTDDLKEVESLYKQPKGSQYTLVVKGVFMDDLCMES